MNCPDMATLESSVAGDLDLELASELDSHLQSCARCHEHIAEIRANRMFLGEMREILSEKVGKPLEGDGFRGYEVLFEIDRGGQGTVLAARQESTGQTVAIKVLHGRADDAARRRRFEREIALMGPLRHRGIVSIFDSGETHSGELFYVMEFVEGDRLDQWLNKHRPSSLESTLKLFLEIGAAVNAAHQRGVIHRDLKPGNILVDDHGHPRILDFGVARFSQDDVEPRHRQTQDGEFVGTFAYASPEQLRGDSAVADTRADVYALGVILFEALTGTLPFSFEGPLAQTLQRIQDEGPPSLTMHGLRNTELDACVQKAMARDTEVRYQSVADFTRDLENYLQGRPVSVKGPSVFYACRKVIQRNRVAFAATFIAVVALVASSVVSIAFGIRSDRDRKEAVSARGLADEQKNAAVLARKRAEDEATRVKRVKTFLLDVLATASPDVHGPNAKILDALERAKVLARDNLESDPVLAAEILIAVGSALQSIGLSTEAEPELKEALSLLAAADLAPLPLIVEARRFLGRCLTDQGKLEEAEAVLEEVLALEDRTIDPTSLLYAEASLATLRARQGDLSTSRDMRDELWQRCREELGDDARLTLEVALDLGGNDFLQEELPGAERMARWVLDRLANQTSSLLLPVDVRAVNLLAAVFHQKGLYRESVDLWESLLERQVALVGSDSGAVTSVKHNLAVTLADLHEMERSEQLHREVWEVRKRLLGPSSSMTLLTHFNLAFAIADQGRVEEAKGALSSLFRALVELEGDDRGLVRQSYRLARRVYTDLSEVTETLSESVRAFESAGDEDSMAKIEILNVYGECLVEARDFEEAQGIGEEALDLAMGRDIANPVITSGARRVLAQCAMERGDLEEAEELLLDAQEELEPDHIGRASWRSVVTLLVQLYERSGDEVSAEEFRNSLR